MQCLWDTIRDMRWVFEVTGGIS